MDKFFQTEQQEGISIADVFKALLGKIKLLIILTLVGAIGGCALGIFNTYNVHYYGTQLEYYVNPKRSASATDTQSQFGVYGAYGKNVMDNMTKLLSSDSFAELLLLDESGLPEKMLSEEKLNDVQTKINVANDAVQEVTDLKEELDDLRDSIIPKIQLEYDFANEKYADAQAEYERESVKLNSALASNVSGDVIKRYENDVAKAKEVRDAEKTVRDEIAQKLQQNKALRLELEDQYKTKNEEALKLLDEANQTKEKILESWRKTPEYSAKLKMVKRCISFAYLTDEEKNSTNQNEFARSFFKVSIRVLNDDEFAKSLLESAKVKVPAYIKDNMAVPSGYVETSCTLTSRGDKITLLNPTYMKDQATKYAFLLAFATLAVACIIILVLENTNKRLRDCDAIPQTFGVPVLGIVPSIEFVAPKTDAVVKKETKTEGR